MVLQSPGTWTLRALGLYQSWWSSAQAFFWKRLEMPPIKDFKLAPETFATLGLGAQIPY